MKSSMTRRLAATLTILVVIVALLGAAVGRKILQDAKAEAPQRSAQAVAVEVGEVSEGAIRDARVLFGSLAARTQFVASAKTSGRLEALLVNIGDVVERNQVVARLDDDEAREAVASATSQLAVERARLEESRSSVEFAEREYQRQMELSGRNISSESVLDAARLEAQTRRAQLAVQMAEVAAAESALRAAEVRRAYTVVNAAWSEGDSRRVVGERFADEGDLLSPNSPIISVLDIDELLAVVYVTERDYPRLVPGQKAQVTTDAFGGRQWSGEIVRIAPQFRESSRQARVEVRVPNADWTLKPGMFVRVGIVLAEKETARTVSRDALTRRRGAEGVFVVEEGGAEGPTVRFVPVTTGIVEGDRVEVEAPADLAGRVVTLGQSLLEDGSRITIATPVDLDAIANGGSQGGAR